MTDHRKAERRAMRSYFEIRARGMSTDALRANVRTFPRTTDLQMTAIRAELDRRTAEAAPASPPAPNHDDRMLDEQLAWERAGCPGTYGTP